MTHPQRVLLPALLLLAALTACSRCGGPPRGGEKLEHTALSRIPAEAEGVVWIPRVGVLGERLAELQKLELLDFAAPLLRAKDGKALVDGMVRQVGIDVRDRASLAQAGIDPDGDLAVALLSDQAPLTVLPVKDARALEATVTGLAQRLAGAGVVTREELAGHPLLRFSTAAGAPPRLALLNLGRHALLATGNAIGALPGLAALEPARSMQSQAVFAASRRRLGGAPVMWAFAPGGSDFLHQGTVEGLTLAFELGLQALVARADVPWPDRQTALGALLPGKGGEPKLGFLPPQAFAVLHYGGNAAALGDLWTWVTGQRVARALEEAGVDVKREVLGNLAPGVVAGLTLSPAVRMSGVPTFDARRFNPFTYAHFTLVAETRDPALATQTLAKLPALAPRIGARVTPEEREGTPVWLTRYAAGEGIHLAQVGRYVTLDSPESALLEAIARLRKPPGAGPLAADLAPLLEGHALAVVVDLHRLADGVRALPSEAWGIGGFALKPTTVRWLDALHELRAVVVTVDAKEQALQAELSLRLKVVAR